MKYTHRIVVAFALLRLLGARLLTPPTCPRSTKSPRATRRSPSPTNRIPRDSSTFGSETRTAQLLGELPKNFAGKSYFIALTVSSGDRYAGLQSGDWVVQWRQYDDRMALIAPNLDVRATGDAESKASVKRSVHRSSSVGRSDRCDGTQWWSGDRSRFAVGRQREQVLWLVGSRHQHQESNNAVGQGLSEQRRNRVRDRRQPRSTANDPLFVQRSTGNELWLQATRSR